MDLRPPVPHLFNTCYTFLAPDDAWSNAITFKPAGATIRTTHMFVSKVEDNTEMRRRAAREAEAGTPRSPTTSSADRVAQPP